MRTARAFMRAGLMDVQQSDFYIDQDTGKRREIDVVVSRSVAIDSNVVMTFAVTIECKSLEHPWIAFPAHYTLANLSAVTSRASTPAGGKWLERLAMRDQWETLPLLYIAGSAAHGVVQSHPQREDRDKAYSAMESAAKAAAWLVDSLGMERVRCHRP